MLLEVVFNGFILTTGALLCILLLKLVWPKPINTAESFLKDNLSNKQFVIVVLSALAFCGIVSGLSMLHGEQIMSVNIGDSVPVSLRFLNALLGLENVQKMPFPDLVSFNVIVRLFLLDTYILLLGFLLKAIWSIAGFFNRFINAILSGRGTGNNNTQNENQQNGVERSGLHDNGQGNVGQENEEQSGLEHNLLVILQNCFNPMLILGLLLAVFLLYLFGSEDNRSALDVVLGNVKSILEAITFLSEATSEIDGNLDLFANFIYVILSMFILAIYILLGCFLLLGIEALIKHWADITQWIKKHNKAVWLVTLAIVMLVISFVALAALSLGIQNQDSLLEQLFTGNKLGLFSAIGNLVSFIAVLCAVVVLFAAAITFIILVVLFGLRLTGFISSGFLDKVDPNLKRKAELGYITLVALIAFIIFSLNYQRIGNFIATVFSLNQTGVDSISYLEVLLYTALFMLILMLFLLFIIVAILFAVFILSSVIKLIKNNRATYTYTAGKILSEITYQIINALLLFPGLLKYLVRAVKTSLRAILQIFSGYKNEPDKNEAILVAACFASLASLINTFLGLRSFFCDPNSPLTIICSLAIASAVQLAMLIAGMKAGERLAEQQITCRNTSGDIVVDKLKALCKNPPFCCFVFAFVCRE